MQELCSFFRIQKGITALIGGGGKTSTMYALAEELRRRGSVIVCTSTHIRKPSQYPFLSRVEHPLAFGEVISVGTEQGEKLSAPEQAFDHLASLADYVLVEADGSKQLPLKAHAPHEPVIPEHTNTVLVVIGIDGLGSPIRAVAHRPERFAALCNAQIDTVIDEKMVHAVVSTYPRCDGIVINKADDAERVDKALSLAKQFTVPIAITAWQTEHPIKSYWRQLS